MNRPAVEAVAVGRLYRREDATFPALASATGFQVVTVGKVARFVNRGDSAENGAVIVVGRDRALATLHDPRCPTASTVALEAYLQSTVRDAVLASVALDCAKWSTHGPGYVYSDPAGTVHEIHYAPNGLRIEVKFLPRSNR